MSVEEEAKSSKVEYYFMPRVMFRVDKILNCRKDASALLTPYLHVRLLVFISALVQSAVYQLLGIILYDVQKHIDDVGT